MDFTAIDVETANHDRASICQIGLVRFKDGQIAETWQTLINPEDYFDGINVSIHGIDDQAVVNAPSFPQISAVLVSYLSRRILVSHTAFDRAAIAAVFGKYGIGAPPLTWLDTAKVVRRTWSDRSRRGYGLASVAEMLGITFQHHNAQEDARAAGEILVHAIHTSGLTLAEWLERVKHPIGAPSRSSQQCQTRAFHSTPMPLPIPPNALPLPPLPGPTDMHSPSCVGLDLPRPQVLACPTGSTQHSGTTDISRDLAKILDDPERLQYLLSLEKQRRGITDDSLVFVGIAHLAQHWWCTQEAVLQSRAKELLLFAAYLSDRILYAHRLGLVTSLPTDPDAILNVGNEITAVHVEHLLKQNAAQAAERAARLPGVNAVWIYQDKVAKDGTRRRLINPDLSPEDKLREQHQAAAVSIPLIDLEDDPLKRGRIYQASRAEKYPTIRWHFPWRDYMLVGVPDGLTDNFVYEFKTTRSRFLLGFMKPVAFAQADLYASFFHRPNKRVQILIVEENVTKTFDQPADTANAEQTLTSFAEVDAGAPPRPPKPWKCRSCEFRTTCPINQAK